MSHKKHLILFSLLIFLLSGCSLFTSHYDAKRHENFTKLKAIHMKFFDDWTAGSDKKWSKKEVSLYCDRNDLIFRQAFEFAKSKDNRDKTGQRAVKILWKEFTANCKTSLKKKNLFSRVFTKHLMAEVEKNYDYAISGELARINASK